MLGTLKTASSRVRGPIVMPAGISISVPLITINLTAVGTYQDASGNGYTGEFKDGIKAGRGSYSYTDGSAYLGAVRDGLKTGQGTMTWPDGSRYVGRFEQDMFNGQGTYTYGNGDCITSGNSQMVRRQLMGSTRTPMAIRTLANLSEI